MSHPVLPIALAISSLVLLALIQIWIRRSHATMRQSIRRFPEISEITLNACLETVRVHTANREKVALDESLLRELLLKKPSRTQLVMTVVVTVAIVGGALYVILSDHYTDDSMKWAYGAIGTIAGYWLKSPA